ncbi:ribosome biogenesis protein wdr12-like [Liolophura sinensis]|uniref:ribosome biogenesis protein wdr12-like n=1 Tax=Liolophura sinensis TaxID=3198878 RepID=UPI0031582500
METSGNTTPHVQVTFVTKQARYSVPDSPFSVPTTVTTKDLSGLINKLLLHDDGSNVDFDFLIDGEFLRVSLGEYLEQKEISNTESVVCIEYVERQPAPEPDRSLLHDDWVSCVQSAANHILSGCYDNTVRLWKKDGTPLMAIPGHTDPVKCVCWIMQGEEPISTFASGSHDQTLLIWQWHREKNEVDCMHMCRGHAGSVDCVAADPTKTRICTGSWDKMLKIWSANISLEEEFAEPENQSLKRKRTEGAKVHTRVPLLTLSGHSEGISSVCWLEVNQVCTASWDHTIRMWDIEKASQKSSLQGSKVFLDLAYSDLSRTLVTASADRHVRLYDPRVTDGALVQSSFTSHNGWVSSVAWSSTNQHLFLSGSYDKVMKLWDTRSPKAPLYNLTGHDDKILAVDWSIPELLISAAADNHIKIFQYHDTQAPTDV